MNKNEKLQLLTVALCCGDALGATSEFVEQQDIPKLFERCNTTGWPFVQAGGGAFHWAKGQHTDDGQMTVSMVRSFIQRGHFDPQDIAAGFVAWLDTSPPDVGFTTRQGLAAVRRGTPWYEGGLADYQRNPRGAANGSLMRNAPVAAMADSIEQAFEFALKHSLPTHYGPLPAVCCCAQTYLLWELLEGRNPFTSGWKQDFGQLYADWVRGTKDPVVRRWFPTTKNHLDALATFDAADFDPDSFQPFGYQFDGKDGYCLLTLQIAVWAALWSQRNAAYPTPKAFPAEVFEKAVGPMFIGAVAMIGHDSDTYGATAGPLIAALHGQFPPALTNNLEVWDQLADMGLSAQA